MTEAPPPTGPRDLTGTILADRYRILKRLGVGAMGEVYLGEHIRMGRKDAIKVLRSGVARDPETMARFTRGARNVSRIRHPHVCQVYDFGEAEDGVLFLAMEFVDGGSLGERLKAEGPLPPEQAVRYLEQAAGALDAAHELGIVHRDLKPDNFMLARTPDGLGAIKVVDFDIARGPAEEEGAGVTRHGFVVGTPEYMSPEQLTGDPLDARSDVYSLTLVLVRMLTGQLPFPGSTAQELMLQRLTEEPVPLRSLLPPGTSLPPAMESVVMRGLARSAADRTPSASALAREARSALQALDPGGSTPTSTAPSASSAPSAPAAPAIPTGATRGSPPEAPDETRISARAPRGRSRGPWIGAAAAAALVVVVAVGWMLTLDEGDTTGPEGSDPVALAEDSAGEAGGAAAGSGDADGQGQADSPPSTPEADPGPETGPEPGAGPEARPEPGAPQPADPEPAPSGTGLDPAQVRPILIRQFSLQDDTGGNPGLSVHLAVRDTTYLVWNTTGISRPDSALAAHILGISLLSMGDTVAAMGWLEEAVRVEPLDRYIRVRDAIRGRR